MLEYQQIMFKRRIDPYSGLEGLDFGMSEWDEKYNEARHWETSAVITVEGYLEISAVGNIWVTNYCTAQIPIEDPSDSSGVIIEN